MKERIVLLLTFPSTHWAIKAEQTLHKNGVSAIVVPVPRHISTDCGIALRFADEDRPRVEQVMSEEGVQYSDIHKL